MKREFDQLLCAPSQVSSSQFRVNPEQVRNLGIFQYGSHWWGTPEFEFAEHRSRVINELHNATGISEDKLLRRSRTVQDLMAACISEGNLGAARSVGNDPEAFETNNPGIIDTMHALLFIEAKNRLEREPLNDIQRSIRLKILGSPNFDAQWRELLRTLCQ